MLQLTKDTASESIIVTLNEKVTIASPYFLFVFTCTSTKDVVTKIYSSAADTSPYPDRYNKFTIATVTVFANKPHGFWIYDVYEQSSSTNTNPDNATLIESGKLKLKPASEFAYEGYDEDQTYKQYQG